MNTDPKAAADKAQEWAYNYEAGYWAVTAGTETINGKTFGGPLIGIAMTEKSAKDLCDAHNASIAAERDKVKEVSHELELAMEAMIQNKQLRDQLAAEREKVKGLHEACRAESNHSSKLREQLAAAQAARAALAKVKVGK